MGIESIARQNLLPERQYLGDDVANANIVPADSGWRRDSAGRRDRSAYWNWLRGAGQTRVADSVESACLEACRPVKQNVVPDHVFVKKPNAATDHSLVWPAKQLPENAKGNIINIIDQRVLKPTPQFLSYSLSKAGLYWLTTTLAQGMGPRIRVNAGRLNPHK